MYKRQCINTLRSEMLQHLDIKNYLLIHNLSLDFYNGFTVITGETGSGKSILLGAIQLLLGERADSGALLDKSCLLYTSRCV